MRCRGCDGQGREADAGVLCDLASSLSQRAAIETAARLFPLRWRYAEGEWYETAFRAGDSGGRKRDALLAAKPQGAGEAGAGAGWRAGP